MRLWSWRSIEQLRKISTQLPADSQKEAEVNLVDLETEAAKPREQRNQHRLKCSLDFFVKAAALIAGSTEFANTAIELANKFGIHSVTHI